MKNNVKAITVGAVTVALTIVMGWMPWVFFVPVLFTSVTRDWKTALFESTFFGVVSLVFCFIMPTSVVAVTFTQNPWIPIVPRIAAGMGCHGVYVGLKKLLKGDGKAAKIVPVITACAVGSLLNTALVVPCLIWRAGSLVIPVLAETFISASIEVAVAVVIVPPLALTVGKALRLKGYYYRDKATAEPAKTATEQSGVCKNCECSEESAIKSDCAASSEYETTESAPAESNAPEN